MCACSHDTSLYNYSLLVRLHVPSKSPICTWKKYTFDHPVRYDCVVYLAYMHTVSAIRLWPTVPVYNNITYITNNDTQKRHRSAKSSAATGAAIHQVDTTSAKARFRDPRVHTQIQQQTPIPCYNSKSPRPKGPLDSACAHAGDGRPYLAEGSSMHTIIIIRFSVHVRRSDRRKRVVTNRVACLLYTGLMPQ